MGGFAIFVFVLLIFAIQFLLLSVKVVPQGMAYTVERFGKYTTTLFTGLNIIVPFVDRIGHKLNIMEQFINVSSQDVVTKDNASVAIEAVVFFQIIDAAKAAYEIDDFEKALLNVVTMNLRTVITSMDKNDLPLKHDEINAQLLDEVKEITQPWGIKVIRIDCQKKKA